jgi:hypothetical protein
MDYRQLEQKERQDRQFDTLLEALAGLAAANIVLVETLHERGVLDKSHCAHALARALDTLAPEHRGGMIEHVLRNLCDRCMNLPPRGASDAREWLARILSGKAT